MSDPTDSVQRTITAGDAGSTALAPDLAVVALASVVDDLVCAQWCRCGQESLASAILEMERQAAGLDAARLPLLAEADARALAKQAGARGTGAWFAHATTSRRARAGAHVALAIAVDSALAATGDALAAGP